MKIFGVKVGLSGKKTINMESQLPTDWEAFHAERVAALEPRMREGAVRFLRSAMEAELPHILELMKEDPDEWWVKHHFSGMMGVRNLLRRNGFSETDFAIDNLDDYAVGLVELAAKPDYDGPDVPGWEGGFADNH